MIKHHVFILMGAILAGCGKPTLPPEPAARKPEPTETVNASVKTNGLSAPVVSSTQVTAKVVSPVITEPTRASAEASDFEGRMAELNALINNTDFGEAIRLNREMQSTFKETAQYNQLAEVLRRLTEYRREAPPLVIAVKNLSSGDSQTVKAAQNELEEADELGRIFLRHALRTKTVAIALAAGERLLALNDTEAIPIFMSHVKTNSVSPLGRASVRALVVMTKKLPPDVAPACLEIVRADTTFSATPVFDILEAVFLRTCERDEARFNERVDCAEGADVLRAHLKAALLATNAAARAWACVRQPEFLPLMNGLRATYYADVTLSTNVLDRIETQPLVEIASKAFSVPGGGTNTLSARWSGDLQVRQAGEYVFTLQCGPSALQTTQLWVDDEKLSAVENWGSLNWQPQTIKKVLSNGWHVVRLEYTKDNSTPDGSIRFVWAGPSAVMRSRPWPEELDAIVRAMADLSSTNSSAWRAARTVLAEAGELSRVHMRNAIVNAPAGTAAATASLLAEWGDTNAPPMLLARLKVEKDEKTVVALADALCVLAQAIEPGIYPELYKAGLMAEAGEMNPYASILCAALWRVCGEDPKKFATLVGDVAGYAKLAAHVQTALSSKDGATLARACRNGYPLAPLMPGLRGRYYDDPEFFKLALERLDGRVEVVNRQFPLATNRQDNISAEWIGSLRIVQPGEYIFAAGGSVYVGVYVDGKLVNTNNWAQEAKVTLAVGLHPVRIIFVQNQPGGLSSASVSWRGPGVVGQVLSSDVLRCAPWDGKLIELNKAVTALTATERAQASAARTVLAGAGEVGRAYMRNAILNAPAGTAAATASLLAEWGDTNAPPMLLARLKVEKDEKTVVALADALCVLAQAIEPGIYPELYKAGLTADAGEMNPYVSILCAALWRVCGEDPKKFGTLVGDAAGYAKLAAHVQTALTSKDGAALARACRNGYPLAPLMSGLRGRYYDDPEFFKLAVERLDGRVEVVNRQFPLATNRQDNISAEWIGSLRVVQPGEYIFAAGGSVYVGVYVDGKLVNTNNWAQEAKVTLAVGLHPVRITFMQNQPGGNSSASVSWRGPGVVGQVLSSDVLRCAPWEGKLMELNKAVTALTATGRAQVIGARTVLAEAGEVGRAYLRNAILNAPAGTAAATASLLAEWGDTNAPPMLLARLKVEKDEKTVVALADALCVLAQAIEPGIYPELYQAGLMAEAGEMNPYASILCAALWRVCGEDPKKFGTLVGDAAGYAKLAAHVQTALTSKDGAALARACRNGYPLAPLMSGLRGRYYDDPEFFKLAVERLDGRVEVVNRQFPLATNRQDNISAEWIGSLRVVQAGEYSFWAGGQTYVGIYVDGKLVNTNNWAQEAKVTLAVGMHPVRITFLQNQPGGNSSASVYWQGTGIVRQVLSSDVLRCAPWDGKLMELDKAMTALTATERAQASAARTVLAGAGEVGRAYLRNAIVNAPAGMAAATASLLAEWGDTNAPPMLLARLKVDKDAAMKDSLTDALCDLAGGIKPDIFPELYRTAFAPDAGAMNPYVSILCAALLARQGDAEAFSTLVKDAQGHQALTRHVQAALASTSDETVRLACLRGAPIAPVMQGLRGRYCAGQAFINPVLETVDPQVNVNNRAFQFPDKRQDDISVRWTGFLDIAVPGSYTFIVNGHSGANVWVDDQLVAQSLAWAENKKDAVKLAKGWHKLRVDFWQSSGSSQVQLSWIPPSGTREVIPAAVLKTAPAASFLAQIEKIVAGLPAAKPEELVAASALLRTYGDVSGFYLDRALRRANPDAIAPVVTMLVEMRDVSLAGKIREMRKTSAPLASKIDACLADLAGKGAPSQAPWFYAVLKTDADNAFPMCGPMLSKVMQETCKNNGNAFNALVGDPQGHATLKTYLDKLPKPAIPTPNPK